MKNEEFSGIVNLLNGDPKLTLFYSTIHRKLWVTAGIRFDSNRCLEKKQVASDFAISVLSIYVVAVTVLEALVNIYIGKPSTPEPNISQWLLFPLTTIIAPIFILVFHHSISGKKYLVNAEVMLRSANLISRLKHRLERLVATAEINPDELKKIIYRYEEVIAKYPENHEDIDFYYFQAKNLAVFERTGFFQFLRACSHRIRYCCDIWGVPVMLVGIPLPFIFFTIKYIFKFQ